MPQDSPIPLAVTLAVLAERVATLITRIEKTEKDIERVEGMLDKLRVLEAAIEALHKGQEAVAAGVASLNVTILAHGQQLKIFEEDSIRENKLTNKRQLDREARTNKIANLILGIMTTLVTAALLATFAYLNSTYKSVFIDAGAVLVVIIIGAVILRVYHSTPVNGL